MKKILVIEDEADLREEIVTWLNLEGYAVTEAENGQKGLEIIMQDPPDMILSDIMMPLMSGSEVLNFLMQKLISTFLSCLCRRWPSVKTFGKECALEQMITSQNHLPGLSYLNRSKQEL